MYVEVVTRLTVGELESGEGLLRETLSSYYSLFDTTRRILINGGPSLAQPSGGGVVAFGHLAVAILNKGIRPLLAHWHPLLEDYEQARPEDVPRLDWERSWERYDEFLYAISEVRTTLVAYAGVLGEVCEAKGLLRLTEPPSTSENP